MSTQRILALGVLVAVALVPASAFADRRHHSGRGHDRAVVVRSAGPRVVVGRHAVIAPRIVNRAVVVRHAVPVRVVRPFYQPYYSFRPRFSIGVGFFAGYPVPYPYGYVSPYPYPYGYPYASGYPYPYVDRQPYGSASSYPDYRPSARASSGGSAVGVVSGRPTYDQGSVASSANYGGISFAVEPSDAEVSVDGEAVGTVGEFSPTSAPLTLTPGSHHIDILAPGYRTLSFDVTTNPGEVIPYRGTLQTLLR